MVRKIKKFDDHSLTMMRKELTNALSDMEKKFGIKIGFGRFNYESNSFTAKMEVFIPDPKNSTSDDSVRLLKVRNNIDKHGWKMGVSSKDLGKIAELGKWGLCEFVGCKDRDSRAPLVFQAEDGSLINASKSYLPR